MVVLPGNYRNLMQITSNVSPAVTTRVNATVRQAPGSARAQEAVDALNDLLSGEMLFGSDQIEPVGERRTTIETHGHTDLLSRLWALVDRPVGKSVQRTYQTQAVETGFGTVYVEVQTGAEYVDRPLTPEEILYLQRKKQLRGDRPMPGDIAYVTYAQQERARKG